MALARYRAKRNFSATPEPTGGKAKGRLPMFVIQRHDASHLHFDLRLEWGGVLKSWAVPKGPPEDAQTKRLAILVEDHPLAYGKFKGVIPAGNYGAGTVEIWDTGTYTSPGAETKAEIEQKMVRGFRTGELKFELQGKRLKGSYALVKLKNAKEKNAWLLIKHAEHSAPPSAARLELQTEVSSEAPSKDPSELAGKRSAMPHGVKPMLAQLAEAPFSRKGWLFEVKWDGYRALAELQQGKVSLFSREHKSFTARFPEIVRSLTQLSHDAILDGEVVVLDKGGKPSFQLLQEYQKTGKGHLVYAVFDVLYADGHDVRQEPLRERKRLLKLLLPKSPNIVYSEHEERVGLALFRSAQRQGLEGVMAKRADSTYQTGQRSSDWLKFKTSQRQEAVIGGYTEPRGSREHIGALILGVYRHGGLIYIGHTGGGSSDASLKELHSSLKKLERKTSPFAEPPKPNAPVHWVEPKLVCEVKFQEWTKEGSMRQPIFLGLRVDKQPREVVKEVPPSTGDGEPIGHGRDLVHFTHSDKLYWTKEKITKGDVLAYYRRVAKYLLPHIQGRPESLHRFPSGIEQEGFYQKDLEHAPAWTKTVKIRAESVGRSIHYLLCDDVETLSYMVQLGCVEIDPWNSRVKSIDRPEYLIMDLDPEGVPFSAVVKTARAVKEVFDSLKVKSYCKTSGATGLHVYVPLAGKYSYEQTRLFAELIAQHVHAKLPTLTSLERSPAKRQHRVYLDYLQNRKGATTVAPYSLRPRPGAPVSTPLHWDEVVEGLDPLDHTLRNIDARLKKVGDLWKPILGRGIDMEACLRRLQKGA